MLTHEMVKISLLQLYFSDKPIYNLYFEVNIDGNLDFSLFERSLNYLLLSQKNLRLNIYITNDNIYQTFNNKKVKIINVKSSEKLIELLETPFDISNDLLLKVYYHNNKLFFLFSDLVIDGVTIFNFEKILSNIYNMLFIKKIPKILCTNYLPKKQFNLKFWKNKNFKNLRNNYKIKKMSTSLEENRIRFNLNGKIYENIKEILKNNNITLFSYFTSLFQLTLKNITGDNNIFIDTIFGDLDVTGVGLYNKVVILDNNIINNDMTIIEYCNNNNNNINEIKKNIVPLELLCYELDIESLPPIRIHFEYSNKDIDYRFKFGDAILYSDMIENSSKTIRQLMIFNVCEKKDNIECYISYKKHSYDEKTIKLLIDYFKNLISIDSKTNIKDLKLIDLNLKAIYKEKIDKRLVAYKIAGKYPNIKYSEFKNTLDNYYK